MNPENIQNSDIGEKCFNLQFTHEDIKDAIDSLSNSASAGPDGFPAILQKKCKNELCHPLEIIYRETLDSSQIPQLLKNAFIIPIFKQGSRQDPANYRPVSLTSHLTKTFERVLRKCIVTHLEVKTKLNNAQHGFHSNRSCLTQLMQHYDDVLKMLENGDNCDSIYLDFSKAFDKVDHGILLHKMKEIGIDGKIALWISNFLQNRQQQVVVNGIRSKASAVISGVPRGLF